MCRWIKLILCMLVDTFIGLKFYAVPSRPTSETFRSRSWVIDFNRLSSKAQVRRAMLSCDSSYSLCIWINLQQSLACISLGCNIILIDLTIFSANLLGLLYNLLESSHTVQQQMLQNKGFLVIGHLLEKVSLLSGIIIVGIFSKSQSASMQLNQSLTISLSIFLVMSCLRQGQKFKHNRL